MFHIHQPRIPDEGTFPAIKLKDGTLLPILTPNTPHIIFIEKNHIPVEEISSGGWIVDGDYRETDRSDTMRYVEQQLARKRMLEKRMKQRVSSIGRFLIKIAKEI